MEVQRQYHFPAGVPDYQGTVLIGPFSHYAHYTLYNSKEKYPGTWPLAICNFLMIRVINMRPMRNAVEKFSIRRILGQYKFKSRFCNL